MVPLPADRLLKRLSQMPTSSLYPLLYPCTYCCLGDDNGGEAKPLLTDTLSSSGVEDCWRLVDGAQRHLPKHALNVTSSDAMLFQPVLVKQADVEYQVMRVCLSKRLLVGMPDTATRLLIEARFDIPPFLRAQVSRTRCF